MLENQQAQLVAGLQELYKRTRTGQGWVGAPLKESSHGTPLTHDILERLGALKQEGNSTNESFEEDLNALQQRLIANGATMMQREPSHDGSSDGASSPAYDPLPQKPKFSNPFPVQNFPPTPPNHSPYPMNARTVSNLSMKSQTYPQVTPSTQSSLAWSTPATDFDESMDFMQYESPMMEHPMDLTSFPPNMFQDHSMPSAINPFMTMKDWTGQEDFSRYVNPAMI